MGCWWSQVVDVAEETHATIGARLLRGCQIYEKAPIHSYRSGHCFNVLNCNHQLRLVRYTEQRSSVHLRYGKWTSDELVNEHRGRRVSHKP